MATARGFREALWAEELVHELSGLTAFFDRWTEELASGVAAHGEDVDIAREESLRLRTLLTTLRQVRPPELKREPTELAALFESALLESALAAQDPSSGAPALVIARHMAPALHVDVTQTFGADVVAPMLRAAAATIGTGDTLEVEGKAAGDQVLCRVWGGRLDSTPQIETRPWLALGRRASDLALARRIVRAHDGQLRWENEGGRALLALRLACSSMRTESTPEE